MGNLSDEMILAEFNQSYNLMMHYHSTQYQILKTFITLHVAVWGAFILLQNSPSAHLKNYVLWIGILVGLLFLFIMISNRYYFLIILHKIEFLRKKYLFINIEDWNGYPQFYSKAMDGKSQIGEKPKMIRFFSTSFLTIILVCIGNTALYYQIDFGDGAVWFQNNKTICTILALVIFITLTILFAHYKQKAIEENACAK